jgi:hypothetical protein
MFEKINIPDCMVIIGLVAALVMAIFYSLNELAMSIASGLLGYIGGTVKSAAQMKGDEKNESIPESRPCVKWQPRSRCRQ